MKLYNSIISFAVALGAIFSLSACSDDSKDGYSLNTSYDIPEISSILPKEGFPSAIVTIKGKNFGDEQRFEDRIGRVYFGGVEASEIVSWSDTEIQVRVPKGGNTGEISVWVWKNHTDSSEEFTCIPGVEITSINPSPAFPGGDIVIEGKNYEKFIDKGLKASDIKVLFPSDFGTVESVASEFTSTSITVKVPTNAKGGVITLVMGDLQILEGPELALKGDMKFDFMSYLEKGGTVSVSESCIDSTKQDGYVIYEFEAPATGLFEAYISWGSPKDGTSVNITIGDDLNTLRDGCDDQYTINTPNTGGWGNTEKITFGPYSLTEGNKYYLRISFFTSDTSWCGNVYELGLSLAAND